MCAVIGQLQLIHCVPIFMHLSQLKTNPTVILIHFYLIHVILLTNINYFTQISSHFVVVMINW